MNFIKLALFILLGAFSAQAEFIDMNSIESEAMKDFIDSSSGPYPYLYYEKCIDIASCKKLVDMKFHKRCYGFPINRDILYYKFKRLDPSKVWRGATEFQAMHSYSTGKVYYKKDSGKLPIMKQGDKLFVVLYPYLKLDPKWSIAWTLLTTPPGMPPNVRTILPLPKTLPIVLNFSKIDDKNRVIQTISAEQNPATEVQTLKFLHAKGRNDYSYICHETYYNHPNEFVNNKMFDTIHENLIDVFYRNVSRELGLGGKYYKY